MPKETRIPGESAPTPAAEVQAAATTPLDAAEQMEAEIERRVQARLAAEVEVKAREMTDTRLHNMRRDQQDASRPLKIVENKALPSIHSLSAAELAEIKRPREFREGWHVPQHWPPNPETQRAEAVAKAQTANLASAVASAVSTAIEATKND